MAVIHGKRDITHTLYQLDDNYEKKCKKVSPENNRTSKNGLGWFVLLRTASRSVRVTTLRIQSEGLRLSPLPWPLEATGHRSIKIIKGLAVACIVPEWYIRKEAVMASCTLLQWQRFPERLKDTVKFISRITDLLAQNRTQ
jgi:hypothetical protein